MNADATCAYRFPTTRLLGYPASQVAPERRRVAAVVRSPVSPGGDRLRPEVLAVRPVAVNRKTTHPRFPTRRRGREKPALEFCGRLASEPLGPDALPLDDITLGVEPSSARLIQVHRVST